MNPMLKAVLLTILSAIGATVVYVVLVVINF